jgi:hypothetical protein
VSVNWKTCLSGIQLDLFLFIIKKTNLQKRIFFNPKKRIVSTKLICNKTKKDIHEAFSIYNTCNSNWREIQEFVSIRGLRASDRPDIVCRIFKMKLDQLMRDLKKDEMFGNVDAGKSLSCFCLF